MNLAASDIDTIAMYRFEPVRGSKDYKHSMFRVRLYIKTDNCCRLILQSKDVARGICESFKTKR